MASNFVRSTFCLWRASNFFKISYLAPFWKFLSKYLHVISNHSYQQVTNDHMGSNTSLAAKGVPAHHHLQCRTACNAAPQWPTGSGNESTPRFLGILSNFR